MAISWRFHVPRADQHKHPLGAHSALPIIAAAIGGGLLLLAWWLPTSVILTVVANVVSLLLTLNLWFVLRFPPKTEPVSLLEIPFRLASDKALFQRYQALTESLAQIGRSGDSIFRDLALEHLDQLIERTQAIAAGTFVFEGTENWRIVYERLLRSPGLYRYRSVAWVKQTQYWQDEPGRKSLAVNLELCDEGQLEIERVVIMADPLWPPGSTWPAEPLRQWFWEQHARGVRLSFVRESALTQEPDLLADIGIYGARAWGVQELDEQCRTQRFTLTFAGDQVSAAEERWNRLAIYVESFANYLDRFELPG